jgi:hypothetical protein
VNYEIRAMSFAEIVDTGFRLVRDHFVLLAGIGFLFYAPFTVLMDILVRPQDPNQIDVSRALGMIGLGLATMILSPIAHGAMTVAIGNVYRGQPIGFIDAYRASLRRVIALLGTALLATLGILVGFILLVLPGLYLMVAWQLVTPIVMLEGIAGSPALSRSSDLLRGHLWRAFGIIMLSVIIVALLNSVLPLLVSGIPFAHTIVSAVAQSVGYAFSTGVLVVLYFDMRCRKENFDLEHLAQLVESAGTPAGVLPLIR